jgi:hypothetical protein
LSRFGDPDAKAIEEAREGRVDAVAAASLQLWRLGDRHVAGVGQVKTEELF